MSALKVDTIKQLANELGTTPGALTNWRERGPAYKTIVTKCLQEGISIDYVFGQNDGSTPDDPIVNDDGEMYISQSHIERVYVERINNIEKKLRAIQKELKDKCK